MVQIGPVVPLTIRKHLRQKLEMQSQDLDVLLRGEDPADSVEVHNHILAQEARRVRRVAGSVSGDGRLEELLALFNCEWGCERK